MSKPLETKVRVGWDARAAQAGVRSLREGFKSVGQSLDESRRQLQIFLGGLVGMQGLRSIAQLSDSYSGLTARLRIVTRGQEEFATALEATRALARQYNQPLTETAALYARLLSALRPLGGGIAEASVATETMLASLKITGSTAAESASAILQFSQALGSGTLRGEEFNAMAEAAPRLLDALAAGLGKPRDELRSLAEQGRLTTSAVVGALRKELPALTAEAAKVPATIGGAAQQVRDAFQTLIGEGGKATGIGLAIVGMLRTLAENVDTVAKAVIALSLAIGTLKLAAFANGLVAAGAAAMTGSVGIAAFGAALKGAIGFISGPAGWIVALAAAALAWTGYERAKRKATARTREQVQEERDAIVQKLAALEAKGDEGATAGRKASVARYQALIAQLNGELDSFNTSTTSPTPGTLDDPGGMRRIREQFRIAQDVRREARESRDLAVQSFGTAIDKAQAAGRNEEAAKLRDELRQRLVAIAKQEKEQLEALAKDATLTRVAQYKERYDQLVELTADGVERSLAANQAEYDQALRSAQEYFDKRAQLEKQQSDLRIAKLKAEEQERQRVLDDTLKVAGKAQTANDKQAAAEAVTTATTELLRVQNEIKIAERDAGAAAAQRARDQQQITDELRRQNEELDFQLKEGNDALTTADLRLAIERQMNTLRQREFAETGDTAKTDALIALKLRQAELQRLSRQYDLIVDQVRREEAAIDREVSSGTETVEDGEKRKLAARGKVLDQLREIRSQQEAIAKTEAEKLGIKKEDETFAPIVSEAQKAGNTMRTSVSQSFSSVFTDFVQGAATAGDAMRGFVTTVARAAVDLIGKRLGAQIAESLIPMGSGAGGGLISGLGSWLTSIFHQGGVVGAGGAPRVALAPWAFNLAPRYHSGGIAGLMPDEVPAVLRAGEEVLREDDPRHRNNLRGAAGVSIRTGDVTINGVGAGVDAQRARAGAQDLQATIDDAIARWVIDNKRPGGLLA
jgi:tape measure domain-containing protein